MRVISGLFKGRKLKSLVGKNTRPTTDKVKESMFNMLGTIYENDVVLDLYSGSGALGIEAISRGAKHAYLVDSSPKAIAIIKENVERTGHPEKFTVLNVSDSLALAKLSEESKQFDVIFLDPPYAKQKIEENLRFFSDENLVTPNAIVVCETDKEVELPEIVDSFSKWKQAEYGISKLTFYKRKEEEHE